MIQAALVPCSCLLTGSLYISIRHASYMALSLYHLPPTAGEFHATLRISRVYG